MPTDQQISSRVFPVMAERVIAGNCLRSANFFAQVRYRIGAEDLTQENIRQTWRALEAVTDSGTEATIATVATHLAGIGWPGGTSLSSLLELDSVPNASDPEYFVGVVLRASHERHAIAITAKIANMAALGYSDHCEEIRELQQQLATLERPYQPPATTLYASIEAAGGINRVLEPPSGQMSSPWPSLNEKLNGGICNGELWILAARPSIGKSTAALQWAHWQAARGKRVTVATLEMSRASCLHRIISNIASIPFADIRRGTLTPRQVTSIGDMLADAQDMPLEVNDQLFNLKDILGTLTRDEKPELLVVDYLGLVEVKRRFENRNQEVSYVSRQLKKAAMERQIPIIVLCQLNRQNENDSRRPHLSDLRESGSLEQDADGVIFLHNESRLKGKRASSPEDLTELLLAKQRNGERDIRIDLKSELAFCRFVEFPQNPAPRVEWD